jgi:hypothetical protein
VIAHPEHDDLLRVVGEIDAEPNAPYLRPDFDPWASVDHDLLAAEIEAVQRGEEHSRG